MKQPITIIIRCIIALTVLFTITKLLGKKQVSQLSLFDYVIGISIGNFAAEIIINMETKFINGILAMTMFGLMAYIIDLLTLKSIKLRRFFMGVPTPLIQNGKILESNLKHVKFDINDLLEECRSNGYFDISQIENALMESKGTLSIMPKGEYQPVTIKDMNLKPKKQSLVANVIIDGKTMETNLKNINKTKEWLEKQLREKGYKDKENILLATLDINEKLTIYEKNKKINPLNILE